MRTRLLRSCALVLLSACKQDLALGRNGSGVEVAGGVIVPQAGQATLGVALSGDAAGAHVMLSLDPDPRTFGVGWSEAVDGGAAALTFTATKATLPQTQTVVLKATNTVTQSSVATSLNLTVAVDATVSTGVDTTAGVGGQFAEVTSTSVQPAHFQRTIPDVDAMAALDPTHVHVQIYQSPWQAQTGDPTADWSFGLLDGFVSNLLGVGDGMPELEIMPPSLPRALNLGIQADVDTFAAYCANLVSYYNRGSFAYGNGGTVTNPRGTALYVRNWGILGDTNTGDRTGAQYVNAYNEAVRAMRAVDDQIAITALEFTDDGTTFLPSDYLSTFVLPADAGGVSESVGSVAVHMFGTAKTAIPSDPGTQDAVLFATVRRLRADLADVRTLLGARRDLADTPIWVTQSNVNANFPLPDGTSNQAPAYPFVNDPRGTDAFFAAWAPYVFSQFGQGGSALLSHWVYTAGHDPGDGDAGVDLDTQNAEVNYGDSRKFLSYWVDKALSDAYPRAPVPPQVLRVQSTDTTSVDVLATQAANGDVTVMVSNLAVKYPGDVDGQGDGRTVIVDLSEFPASAFASATQLIVDGSTPRDVGPAATPVTLPASMKVDVELHGYGVAFLKLTR